MSGVSPEAVGASEPNVAAPAEVPGTSEPAQPFGLRDDVKTSELTLPDGRTLAYTESGDPRGFPIIVMHRGRSSAAEVIPLSRVLYRSGLRAIRFDRAGCGESTRLPGRQAVDTAKDTYALADHLEINEFGVLGIGAGGPHALACSTVWPPSQNRVVVTGLLGSSTPYSEGDNKTRRTEEIQLRQERELLLHGGPNAYYETVIKPNACPEDVRFFGDIPIRRLVTVSFARSVRDNIDGRRDEERIRTGQWGFSLREVDSQVFAWHGREDTVEPVEAAEAMVAEISRARFSVIKGCGHYGITGAIKNMMTAMADYVRTIEDGFWPHSPEALERYHSLVPEKV